MMGDIPHAIVVAHHSSSSTHPKLGVIGKHKKLHRYAL
jgi:hypothetical protein